MSRLKLGHQSSKMMRKIIVPILFISLAFPGNAFVNPAKYSQVQVLRKQSDVLVKPSFTSSSRFLHQQTPFKNINNINDVNPSTSTSCTRGTTSLQMGFNLPPPEPKSDVESILTTAGIIAGITLFFMSPLGGIFFAITNSLLLLIILIPFIASIGFTVWQSLYTIEAPCPSCNAPARVLKDEEAGPNICLNCGALVRANLDKDGIELCNNPNDIYDESSRVSSIFDLFKGDVVSDGDPGAFFGESSSATPRTTMDVEDQKKKEKRERTIIDVDVKDD